MASSVQSSLTSDIQLALQHAVVEANNAFGHSSNGIPSPKRKRKRRKEEGTANEEGNRVKEKKKKRKKQDVEQAPDVGPPIVPATTVGETLTKKKSRKDKGKQTAHPHPHGPVHYQTQDTIPQIDPQLTLPSNDSSQASTAAFLSAIVAAATATPELDPSQTQPHPQYHPQMVPQLQYLPYPPMQYDYNLHPHFPQQSQPPTLFPTPMTLPFSELAFESNDDVLRALQDLDISKIANVLKTLGEAAAAANVPLDQPSFIPPAALHQAQAPTPLGQVPTASNTILGIPQKQTNAPEHRGVIDMNLPPPEHHTSADHAHLLANKWLNANKLAELVRTEGMWLALIPKLVFNVDKI
jgi:hypothetical protein